MNLMFDLDGTIVATRQANYEAYRAIGITPPEDFWIIPWEGWCTVSDHNKKQLQLTKTLPIYGSLLPAARLLFAAGGEIITNASLGSVNIIRSTFPVLKKYHFTYGLNHDRKIALLNKKPPGIYFDDQSEFVLRVRKETQWQCIDVSGL